MNTIRAALTLGIAMSFMASPAQADDWPSQMSRVPVLACDSPESQGVVRDWLAREPGFEITMQTTRWNTNCSWRSKDGSEHLTVKIVPTLEGSSDSEARQRFYEILEGTGAVRSADARVAYPIWTRDESTAKSKRLSAMITVPGSEGFSALAESVQEPPFAGPQMKDLKDMAVELNALIPPKALRTPGSDR